MKVPYVELELEPIYVQPNILPPRPMAWRSVPCQGRGPKVSPEGRSMFAPGRPWRHPGVPGWRYPAEPLTSHLPL